LKSKEKMEKTLLDYFFEFLKFDLNSLNYDNLISVSLAYVRFVYHNDAEKLKQRHELLSFPAYEQTNDKLEDVKNFIDGLQIHFKRILESIYNLSVLGLALRQQGVRVISLKGDAFNQIFQINDKPSKDLDLELEIPYAESVFADIIINENLLPKRFKKCPQCQSFFYQKTNRPITYCSSKCSNLYRQHNHMLRTRSMACSGSLSDSHLKTIGKRAKEHQEKQRNEEIDKLRRKLPLWAVRQNQINAKILTLFLRLKEQGASEITEAMLSAEYDNPKEFNRNFTQMKIIAEKNQGKVFHVTNGIIKIWKPARELVEEYKKAVFGK